MEFLIIAFATWYLSYAVTSSDCPFGLCKRIREAIPLGGLLTCIVCLSLWVGIALALLTGQPIVNGIGAAGLACLLHSYTGWKHGG